MPSKFSRIISEETENSSLFIRLKFISKKISTAIYHRNPCSLFLSLYHAPAAVWAHLHPVFEFIRKTVSKNKVVHLLSDSPSTQYSNKTIFYLIVKALKELFLDLEVSRITLLLDTAKKLQMEEES